MLCFAGVAVFGAIQGIGIAVVIAVIEFLWDGWRPQLCSVGARVEGVMGRHEVMRYPKCASGPGVRVVPLDAPLFFANVSSSMTKRSTPWLRRRRW